MRHNKAVNHLGRKSGHRRRIRPTTAVSYSATSRTRRLSQSSSARSLPRLQTVPADTPACSMWASVREMQPKWP